MLSFSNKIVRRLLEKAISYPIGIAKLFLEIHKIKSQQVNTVCLTVSSGTGVLLWTWLFCRLMRIPYLNERSEYPFCGQVRSRYMWINDQLYKFLLFRIFDGMIVITDALEKYYRNLTKTNCLFFKLPILIELDKYSNNSQCFGDINSEYITYCGNMTGDKDGILDLLQAFSLVSTTFLNCKLRLIGGADNYRWQEIKAFLHQNSLEKKVELTGLVPSTEVPKLLKNSKILVLARPNSRQAEGGFPTKIGEYLATGHPVIVTAVGEIPNYIVDGVNGFLAPPGDPFGFAQKMLEVLKNPEKAIQVGKEGKKLAESEFNYLTQSKRLYNFLNLFVEKANHKKLMIEVI